MRTKEKFTKKLNITFKYSFVKFIKLFLPVVVLLFSKNTLANDTLGIALDTILFFESGDVIPNKQDRVYKDYFKLETKYINIEFNIKNLKYEISDQEYDITFIWRYLNGEEFGRSEANFNIQSDWLTAYINRGWGFKDIGSWPIGLFTVQILINNNLFAEQDFFITPYETGFITLPKSNKTVKELQNLPEDISSEIIQQIKIPTWLNTYFNFDLSHTGNDISFRLDKYLTSTSKMGSIETTTTSKHVHLFKNHKQILPVCYNIRPYFDDKLEKLVYSKLIPNKNAKNYHLNKWYGYYNGVELYSSLIDARIYLSPTNNKPAYILGYNNSKLQRGMGLQILANYEYLIIEQQKKQPECLSNSKRIKINHPLVFISNNDSTYNAYYTAEFKEGRKSQYALFNEDKIISDKYNGYIGKPHLLTDKKHIACVVQNNNEYFIIIDNKRITKGYNKIKDDQIYYGYEQEVIYEAEIDGKWYIIKGDNIISDGFQETGALLVKTTSKEIIYKAKLNEKWSVYNNKGKMSPEFDEIGENITLNQDETKIAYAAANNNSMFVMINDNKISQDFELFHHLDFLSKEGDLAISNLIFDKSGEKIAYMLTYKYTSKFPNSIYDKNPNSYLMVNNTPISPKMYHISLVSNKPGQLIYVGINISDLLINHVKINF